MSPEEYKIQDIEVLNEVAPYCFESDREEQWFKVGLQYGLDAADAEPLLRWISVKDDLPCNHNELIIDVGGGEITKNVVCFKPCRGICVDYMYYYKSENRWRWTGQVPTHWFFISKPPKE